MHTYTHVHAYFHTSDSQTIRLIHAQYAINFGLCMKIECISTKSNTESLLLTSSSSRCLTCYIKKQESSSVSSSSRLVLSASTAVGLVHFHSKLLGEEYTLQRMHASLCSHYRAHTLVRKHAKKQAHAYIASQQSP